MKRRREKQVRKFYWLWGPPDYWPDWAQRIFQREGVRPHR